jgi:hypothetical protein
MKRQFVEVAWDETRQKIVCHLPLTSPTGRVRVKRDGHPLATRQTTLQASDVIEWQIAYRDEKGQLVELGQALQLAWLHGLISDADIDALKADVERQQEFFDEQFRIEMATACSEFYGFQLHRRRHPVLRCEMEGHATVDIELCHRQRAVGFQAMVFLLIPISQCEPVDIVGRKAKPKEKVAWTPSRKVLETLAKAFAIASRSHRDDMLKLLKALKEG